MEPDSSERLERQVSFSAVAAGRVCSVELSPVLNTAETAGDLLPGTESRVPGRKITKRNIKRGREGGQESLLN